MIPFFAVRKHMVNLKPQSIPSILSLRSRSMALYLFELLTRASPCSATATRSSKHSTTRSRSAKMLFDSHHTRRPIRLTASQGRSASRSANPQTPRRHPLREPPPPLPLLPSPKRLPHHRQSRAGQRSAQASHQTASSPSAQKTSRIRQNTRRSRR